jgi:hypothetical protein
MSRFMPIALVLCLILLAACGGSGGSSEGGGPPPPAPLTGVFGGGPVQALHYQTATRSGLTSASGEFAYLPGETVTFSVGGIQLGSATGAPQVNLFTLRGMAPPATAAAIGAEMRRANDVTDFDRVANMALLLVALDQDRNPGNGLDLTGQDAALAGTTIGFDVPWRSFPSMVFDSFARARGINRRVPLDQPLIQLYRALGVSVTAQAQTAFTRDADNNGTVDFSSDTGYDPQGRLALVASDNDGDGYREYATSFTYDGSERSLTTLVRGDGNDDGVVDVTQTTTYSYGPDGSLMTLNYIGARDADGSEVIDLRQTTSYVYATNGDLLSDLTVVDNAGDGVIDGSGRSTYSYDGDGMALTRSIEGLGAAGVVETRTSYTYTRDSTGRVATEIQVDDADANGVGESRRSVEYAYDAEGNLINRATEGGTDANGVPNIRDTYRATYDARGEVLTEVSERDSNADGTVNSRTTTVNTYDASGRVVTSVLERDPNADGVINSRRSSTYTYAADGALTAEVQDDYSDGDGATVRTVYRHTYDANGKRVTTIAERDVDQDHVPDSTSVETLSYVTLSDGVGFLIR